MAPSAIIYEHANTLKGANNSVKSVTANVQESGQQQSSLQVYGHGPILLPSTFFHVLYHIFRDAS